MFSILFSQIALASATMLSVPPVSPPASAPFPRHAEAVTTSPRNETALDILNNSRPDILGRGAAHRCPPVTAVYVDGHQRFAPAIDHGFSRATLYFAGDTVMVMLPPSIADALRTIPADSVQDIRYVDCLAGRSSNGARNTLFVTTK